jgi:hypothetical protein
MKVDLFKFDEIVILDSDGKFVERFKIKQASTIAHNIRGNILELTKDDTKTTPTSN